MSSKPEFQLTTPDSVAADPAAVEILRLWWSKKEPVMSLKPAFDDPKHFGQVLAHIAKSMAFAYSRQKGMDQDAAYRAILQGLHHTLAGPGYETVAESNDVPSNRSVQ
jgi:hypothetical protein